jgi:hypothetical protein
MSRPPGFVHFEACQLPLCPLRENLVAVCKVRKQREDSYELDGLVDGAVLSRGAAGGVTSSDKESKETGTNSGVKSGNSSENTVRHALSLSRSEPSDSESKVKVTAAPESAPTKPLNDITSIAQPPPLDNMEYIDFSGPGLPLSPYDTDEEEGGVLLSLSHEGTLRKSCKKRKRAQSPTKQGGEDNRTKREPTPDLSGYPSILERKRRMNHWDLKLVKLGQRQNPAIPVPLPYHNLPPRPVSGTADKPLTQRCYPRDVQKPPTGPRALGGKTPICFYWYHKGRCIPKKKNGRTIKCTYAHTVNVPHAQVSLPPGITDHNPYCALPLCPARMRDSVKASRTIYGMIPGEKFSQSYARASTWSAELELGVKNEPHTPSKLCTFPAHSGYSSPIQGDDYTPGPAHGKTNDEPFKTPGLSDFRAEDDHLSSCDASREAHQVMEGPQFYVDLGCQPLLKVTDANKQICEDRMGKESSRRMKREERKEKKEEKRRKRQAEIVSRLFSKLDNDPEQATIHNALSIRARRGQKPNPLRSRRAQRLFEADAAKGGRMETFDPEAELYQESFHPIAGLPDRSIPLDVRDEREEKAQGAANAIDLIQTLNQNPYKYHPMMLEQPAVKFHDKNKEERCYGNVIDGKRLDWDTDLVRRLFGEDE